MLDAYSYKYKNTTFAAAHVNYKIISTTTSFASINAPCCKKLQKHMSFGFQNLCPIYIVQFFYVLI